MQGLWSVQRLEPVHVVPDPRHRQRHQGPLPAGLQGQAARQHPAHRRRSANPGKVRLL